MLATVTSLFLGGIDAVDAGPVGVASCIGPVQACLLGSSWRWVQAAYGLTQL